MLWLPHTILCPADALRDEAGFRRGYDGHVVLLSRDGDPVEVSWGLVVVAWRRRQQQQQQQQHQQQPQQLVQGSSIP